MNARILLWLLAALLIYMLRDFLLILFVAFLLTTGLLPVVQWLKQKKIPRSLSSIILIAGFLILPLALIARLGPVLYNEGRSLADNAPQLLDQLETRLGIDFAQEVQERVQNNSGQLLDNIFSLTGSLFSLLAVFILTLVIAIYWIVYYNRIKEGAVQLLPLDKNSEKFVRNTYAAVERRLGSWVKGQALISLAVGLLTWVVLLILGVPYAGVLAAIAAILELVPTLGPLLASIPALLIALTISPRLFALVAVAYIIIQQIENYLIAPRVLGQAVHMNPFAILLSIVAGTYLFGLIGALIAVPAVITLEEIYNAWRKRSGYLPEHLG